MILRPNTTKHLKSQPGPASAWEAIARTQKHMAVSYLLIRQPDHARLAGQLVEHMNFLSGAVLDEGIVKGISLHDEGWAAFDDGPGRYDATGVEVSAGFALNGDGKPISFLEVKAADAIRAWCGSVEVAERCNAIAGLLVSHHFVRIAGFGLGAGHYSEQDCVTVHAFLAAEEARQRRLQPLQRRTEQEVQYWTDVLQFCDLLSLYLCCGSDEWIEFPHRVFGPGRPMTAEPQGGECVLSPATLKQPCSFALPALRCPATCEGQTENLSWCLR